jgi:phosphoribosyl 1,2-cyclic phosphodiesterase
MRAADETAVSVKFWGVRGSIPTAGNEVMATGGNTACIEVRCGRHILLLDAGTGLRKAGLALAEEGVRTYNIILSHWHYDHVIGLPFFAPLFDPLTDCAIWSGHISGAATTQEMVGKLLSPPFFPAGPAMFRARTAYHDFKAGDVIRPFEAVTIETAELDHPGGVIGYRIKFDGRAISYLTDTGTGSDAANAAALRLADRADVVIYDCMYTDEEARERPGFGHSTWREGVALCKRAGARKLAMFHHAPDRDDAHLNRLEKAAHNSFAGAFAAREGMRLDL